MLCHFGTDSGGVGVFGMVEDWITSPAGRKAIGTFADARPSWLWSGDGKTLIWSNPAARLRGAKFKRHKVKLAPPLIPIKGQVTRLMRLGALGRPGLSRMRFTIGGKPASVTCTCTPLTLENSTRALLVVEVDALERDIIDQYWSAKEVLADIFAPDIQYAVYNKADELIAGTHDDAPQLTLPAGHDGETIDFFAASGVEQVAPDPANDAQDVTEDKTALTDLPDDEGASEQDESTAETDSEILEDQEAEQSKPKNKQDLSVLLEKLSNDERLFEPLSEADDAPLEPTQNAADPGVSTQEAESDNSAYEDESEPDLEVHAYRLTELDPKDDVEPDNVGALVDHDAGADSEKVEITAPEVSADDVESGLWQVVGRSFVPNDTPGTNDEQIHDAEAASADEPDDIPTVSEQTAQDTARVEQKSRYNFAELSRILNDRIAGERAVVRQDDAQDNVQPSSAELVNLSDENLVLNRLPLGLLVFRDQQILFVNRAMTDLVGYPDSASLRAQGLDGVFPRHANDDDPFGPVTHLAHRGGGRVPVSARLQAISWQGAPALMLTARAQTPMQGIEGAIRNFAEQLATMQGCGYFETSRAGIISSISGRGADLFNRTPQVLIGRPLMLMADQSESAALRSFLEKAARKAETTRPSIILRGIDPRLKIYLFAEGQAGFVTGYFGLVQQVDDSLGTAPDPTSDTVSSSIDMSVLTRMSRNIRRPLNTIIGFADLLQSHAFGPIENERYVEYARDIKSSGQEIEHSVDELEELVRINNGDYLAAPAEFDLATLLDMCISRVRTQAGNARVFVRSAISDQLPRIRADEASLSQAVLNMLASAIEQTPPGGHVVVSAQREDDGSVAVHVRDSGAGGGDITEQFVVFRDDQDGLSYQSQGSSVGLVLTRSLLAINTCTLAIEAGAGQTTVLSLIIPADLATSAE